jgi:hypothetical protein
MTAIPAASAAAGPCSVISCPVGQQCPGVRLIHPREDLHQRGLARAVLADQGVHLPGMQLDRPVDQGLYGPERLGRVPQHQDRAFRGIAHLVRVFAESLIWSAPSGESLIWSAPSGESLIWFPPHPEWNVSIRFVV